MMIYRQQHHQNPSFDTCAGYRLAIYSVICPSGSLPGMKSPTEEVAVLDPDLPGRMVQYVPPFLLPGST